MWVSASDIGRAASCPRYLQLKMEGHPVSHKARYARRQGDRAHKAFNQSLSSNDRRCFIASYHYGADDPRTEALRLFRNIYLHRSVTGRLLVWVYYKTGPFWIHLCRWCTPIHTVTRILVIQVTRRAHRLLVCERVIANNPASKRASITDARD